MILKNGFCFLDNEFHKTDILISNGKISAIGENITGEEVVDVAGNKVIPGLMDIHTHGCVGHDFCDEPSGYEAMSQYYLENGITSVLATSLSLSPERLTGIFSSLGEYIKSHSNGVVKGIHMEGPFFNKEKKGAHDERYIIPMDSELFETLQTAAQNTIKLIDLAPEKQGVIEFIKEKSKSVTISVAHTTADYATAMKAFAAGADHATHLYNAMPTYSHREPGVVGAVFDSDNVYSEIISDGIHIHEAVIRAAFRQIGKDRMVLISDSMCACGVGEGTFELGGLEVTVTGSKATLKSGAIAGSVTNLFECMKKAISYGIPEEHAILAATINPARSVKLDSLYGSIEVGKYADLVVVDDSYNILKVFHGE